MEKELLFKTKISENQNNFDKKKDLIQFFRLHKEISEKAFELISVSSDNNSRLLSHKYTQVNEELKSRKRGYEQLHNEKVLVDIYSAFEKLLYDHLRTLYSLYPKVCFPDARLSVRLADIFLTTSLENTQEFVIEETVKGEIQSNTIDKILELILKKVQLKNAEANILSADEKSLLLYLSKIRNLIIHNESLMNKIVLEDLKKIGVMHSHNENQSVSENLDDDISKMEMLFEKISKRLTNKLLEEAKKINIYDNKKIVL